MEAESVLHSGPSAVNAVTCARKRALRDEPVERC